MISFYTVFKKDYYKLKQLYMYMVLKDGKKEFALSPSFNRFICSLVIGYEDLSKRIIV